MYSNSYHKLEKHIKGVTTQAVILNYIINKYIKVKV